MKREDNDASLRNRYEAILAAVPEILMEVNSNKVYTWANNAGTDFFGTEVVGKEASFYFEGEQDIYSKVQPVFDGEQNTVYLESWQRRKDGERRLLAWWCRTLKDDKGQVIGALSSARDITESKKAEDALLESEKWTSDLIFSIADWIWEVNENGIYTYSSNKIYDILGWFSEEVIGKTPFDFMPPDEAERIAPIFSEILAKKAPINDLENWNVHKNGKRVCLVTNGVPILDKEGNLKGYRGVDKDITERKNLEEEKQKLFQEMEVFYKASLGREERIIELKKEVEDLKKKLG